MFVFTSNGFLFDLQHSVHIFQFPKPRQINFSFGNPDIKIRSRRKAVKTLQNGYVLRFKANVKVFELTLQDLSSISGNFFAFFVQGRLDLLPCPCSSRQPQPVFCRLLLGRSNDLQLVTIL
ncbi:hypothetical protein D3C86_1424530 [compost metagenome]